MLVGRLPEPRSGPVSSFEARNEEESRKHSREARCPNLYKKPTRASQVLTLLSTEGLRTLRRVTWNSTACPTQIRFSKRDSDPPPAFWFCWKPPGSPRNAIFAAPECHSAAPLLVKHPSRKSPPKLQPKKRLTPKIRYHIATKYFASEEISFTSWAFPWLPTGLSHPPHPTPPPHPPMGGAEELPGGGWVDQLREAQQLLQDVALVAAAVLVDRWMDRWMEGIGQEWKSQTKKTRRGAVFGGKEGWKEGPGMSPEKLGGEGRKGSKGGRMKPGKLGGSSEGRGEGEMNTRKPFLLEGWNE